MNKKSLITLAIVAIVFGGGGFWGGMIYAQGQATAARAAFTGGAGGSFAGRTGAAGGATRAAGGGATFGTILSIDPTSITIQLPTSTSTSATTGSKIVLYDSSTQIQELQNVPASSLSVGQSVTVTGTANSDGSMTASSIQVRPAGSGTRGAPMIPAGQ